MSNYRELAAQGDWVAINGLYLYELARQEYGENHCVLAVGLVEGYPLDTHYLWLEKDNGGEPVVILLRADELASIAWLCSGALWSHLNDELMAKENATV